MTDIDELRIDRQDGYAYTLEAFIDEYGGSVEDPPSEWLAAPAAAALARSRSPRRGDDASETATLTELWKQRSWTEAEMETARICNASFSSNVGWWRWTLLCLGGPMQHRGHSGDGSFVSQRLAAK